MSNTYEKIIEILKQTFSGALIDLVDQSAFHAGHPGAASGGGHYYLLIVTEEFEGKSLIERHQAVYGALEGKLTEDYHALAIKAYTPGEWEKKKSDQDSSSGFNILPS